MYRLDLANVPQQLSAFEPAPLHHQWKILEFWQ